MRAHTRGGDLRGLMLHLNAWLHGGDRLEVAGAGGTHKTLLGLRARVGIVFQGLDDQLFMPPFGTRWPSAR